MNNQKNKNLLIPLLAILVLVVLIAVFLLNQLLSKSGISISKKAQDQKFDRPIIMNPVLNVSQNQKFMELLNLDNQIIALLGSLYLQTNPTASYLSPYTKGVSQEEISNSTSGLKDLFRQRDSLIKDLGLVEEEQ